MKKIKYFKVLIACFVFAFTSQNYAIEVIGSDTYGTYKKSEYSNQIVVHNWSSAEGKKRFERSKYKNAYYDLASFYAPQIHPTYCGIASAAMVLNALRVPVGHAEANLNASIVLPSVYNNGISGEVKTFHLYDQNSFFNEKTETIKPRSIVELKNVTPENETDASNFDPGLTLMQLKKMLEAHKARVSLTYAQDHDFTRGIKKFRDTLKTTLSQSNGLYIIVNLYGYPLGMNSGGHFSPVAAYDELSDSVMLFEVAAVKRPWLWISLDDLYHSMATQDDDGNPRGYLIVSEGQKF